jgi:hypothetical protein
VNPDSGKKDLQDKMKCINRYLAMSRKGLNMYNPLQAKRSWGYKMTLTLSEVRSSSICNYNNHLNHTNNSSDNEGEGACIVETRCFASHAINHYSQSCSSFNPENPDSDKKSAKGERERKGERYKDKRGESKKAKSYLWGGSLSNKDFTFSYIFICYVVILIINHQSLFTSLHPSVDYAPIGAWFF